MYASAVCAGAVCNETRPIGYWFTLIYILVAYLTPTFVFGVWGQFHLEVLIVAFAVILSLPNLFQSKVLQSTQAVAFAGMGVAVLASIAKTGWLGGAVSSFYGFLQPSIAFFLAAANCRKKWHFQVLFLALFAGSLFYIGAAWSDLRNAVFPSVYLYGSEDLRRARGLGLVNDPNDLCQVLVCLVPAVFLWKTGNKLLNFFLIGIPVCLLLTGMYLTHSRGGALALIAVILVSARRKIGTVLAGTLAGVLFVLSVAIGWSGGRETSLQGGADRLELWSSGLTMIKVHPLFGVGMGNFSDYAGNTAHNSVVVCAAEIGLTGFFFWVLLLFTDLRAGAKLATGGQRAVAEDRSLAAQPRKTAFPTPRGQEIPPARLAAQAAPRVEPATVAAVQSSPFTYARYLRRSAAEEVPTEHADIRRTTMIVLLSITGFLTAGWFLSRAISIWLFLLCGMLYSTLRMAEEKGLPEAKDKLAYLLTRTLALCLGLLGIVYVMVRAGH